MQAGRKSFAAGPATADFLTRSRRHVGDFDRNQLTLMQEIATPQLCCIHEHCSGSVLMLLPELRLASDFGRGRW